MEFQILKKYNYIAIILVAFLFSCRKDVKVKLPEYKERLVVEANIETGKSAVVLLSWSVPFFGDFDYSTPEKALLDFTVVCEVRPSPL